MRVLRSQILSGCAAACAATLFPWRAAAGATGDPLYSTAFRKTLDAHARIEDDGTTYVWTGDIPAMWLRDSSAIALPYIEMAKGNPMLAALLRGVLARQAKCILKNPYANAFRADYGVFEEKFEIDSLIYPIWFAALYFKKTGDKEIFTPELRRALQLILTVLRKEQRHAARSHYRNSELQNGGRGSPVRYTGMIWTAFRPSDDAAQYHYNIPHNAFAAVVLQKLTYLARNVLHDPAIAAAASSLATDIRRGIESYGYVHSPRFGKIYAYEVDGFGHTNLMDDANLPSLLSFPYFGYLSVNDPAYQRTRRFALSAHNPYFFTGKYATGIGSPHTPHNYVWPLALVMQALTSSDEREIRRCLRAIAASDLGDHRLHESFHVDHPRYFTRADFALPNALYAQLAQQRRFALATS